MAAYDYVPQGYSWSEPARESAREAEQRRTTSTPRRPVGSSLALSGYDRAEENRFRTLSEINQRDSTVPRNFNYQSTLPGPRSARPEDVDAWIRANYGYMAGFLDHPEVGPILREAALAGWDEHRLYGRVSQTQWWRTTSAAQRTWQALMYEDPAEAQRQVAETAAMVNNRARSLGLPMSSGQIAGIAAQATANGWSDAQVIDSLVSQINWATIEAGDLTALRDDVKAVAGDYLVGVNESTAQNYAARIASGELTIQGVQSAMREQAKARFGYIADQLDQGITVKDYFRPIRDVIANELEVTAEEIDLTDSRWLKMVENRDEKGQLRAATMNEAMLAARKTPEWASTRKAQESTTKAITQIAQVFGRRIA